MDEVLDLDGKAIAVGDTVLTECQVSQLLPLEGESGFNLRVIITGMDGFKTQISLRAKDVLKAK